MNKATKARNAAAQRTTTMVRDGITYRHDPSTIGHRRHTAECWIEVLGASLPVDVDTITEYGLAQRLSFSIRVF